MEESTEKQTLFYEIRLLVTGRTDLFSNKEFKAKFLKVAARELKRWSVPVCGWVLLEDEFQVILIATDDFDPRIHVDQFCELTSLEVIQAIEYSEHRQKGWLLHRLDHNDEQASVSDYKLWSERKIICTDDEQKAVDWIKGMHQAPVAAGLVESPIDYEHSSARDYEGGIGDIAVDLLF